MGPVSCRARDPESGRHCVRRRWHWGVHRAVSVLRGEESQVRWRGRGSVAIRVEWVPS